MGWKRNVNVTFLVALWVWILPLNVWLAFANVFPSLYGKNCEVKWYSVMKNMQIYYVPMWSCCICTLILAVWFQAFLSPNILLFRSFIWNLHDFLVGNQEYVNKIGEGRNQRHKCFSYTLLRNKYCLYLPHVFSI